MSDTRSRRIEVANSDSMAWLGLAALIALVAATALGILGVPPVDLHGPLHRLGIMDPFCGGTRAARFFMTGDWASAWRYNPGIFAVALVFGLGLSRWVYGRTTGRWLLIQVGRRNVALALVVGLVVLEVNQQLNANLLIQP